MLFEKGLTAIVSFSSCFTSFAEWMCVRHGFLVINTLSVCHV